MAKQVAINDLKPGMFIVGVIEQNGPVKIRKSGLVTSHEMVQGLLEMGVISVAIDPEKTVEIEVDDTVHVSQTQFVMQANQEKASADTDNHLAEQFNRSLFMPSLQKVPSVWQYYGVKVAVAFLIILLGLGTGWFAAVLPSMLTKTDIAAVSGSRDQVTDNEETNVLAQTSDSDASAPQQAQAAAEIETTQASPVASATASELVVENVPQSEAQNLVSQGSSNSPAETNSQATPQIATSPTDNLDNTTGNIVTETPSATQLGTGVSRNVVSPELLQRFEAAMADLERESSPDLNDDGTLEYGDPGNSFNTTDVQRVDQLPARVMTRLPRMSFSAHMYASNPRNRWVKVNGVEMGEGEWLDEKIFIEKIEPQHVILLFEGHQFSMRALSEW